MSSLTLEILTPEQMLVSETVTEFYVPTVCGEIGILPGHADMVTVLSSGESNYKTEKEKKTVNLNGGILKVANDKISIFTD